LLIKGYPKASPFIFIVVVLVLGSFLIVFGYILKALVEAFLNLFAAPSYALEADCENARLIVILKIL